MHPQNLKCDRFTESKGAGYSIYQIFPSKIPF